MSDQEEFDKTCDGILYDFEILEKDIQELKKEEEKLQQAIDDAFRALGTSEEELEQIKKDAKVKARRNSIKQVK